MATPVNGSRGANAPPPPAHRPVDYSKWDYIDVESDEEYDYPEDEMMPPRQAYGNQAAGGVDRLCDSPAESELDEDEDDDDDEDEEEEGCGNSHCTNPLCRGRPRSTASGPYRLPEPFFSPHIKGFSPGVMTAKPKPAPKKPKGGFDFAKAVQGTQRDGASQPGTSKQSTPDSEADSDSDCDDLPDLIDVPEGSLAEPLHPGAHVSPHFVPYIPAAPIRTSATKVSPSAGAGGKAVGSTKSGAGLGGAGTSGTAGSAKSGAGVSSGAASKATPLPFALLDDRREKRNGVNGTSNGIDSARNSSASEAKADKPSAIKSSVSTSPVVDDSESEDEQIDINGAEPGDKAQAKREKNKKKRQKRKKKKKESQPEVNRSSAPEESPSALSTELAEPDRDKFDEEANETKEPDALLDGVPEEDPSQENLPEEAVLPQAQSEAVSEDSESALQLDVEEVEDEDEDGTPAGEYASAFAVLAEIGEGELPQASQKPRRERQSPVQQREEQKVLAEDVPAGSAASPSIGPGADDGAHEPDAEQEMAVEEGDADDTAHEVLPHLMNLTLSASEDAMQKTAQEVMLELQNGIACNDASRLQTVVTSVTAWLSHGINCRSPYTSEIRSLLQDAKFSISKLRSALQSAPRQVEGQQVSPQGGRGGYHGVQFVNGRGRGRAGGPAQPYPPHYAPPYNRHPSTPPSNVYFNHPARPPQGHPAGGYNPGGRHPNPAVRPRPVTMRSAYRPQHSQPPRHMQSMHNSIPPQQPQPPSFAPRPANRPPGPHQPAYHSQHSRLSYVPAPPQQYNVNVAAPSQHQQYSVASTVAVDKHASHMGQQAPPLQPRPPSSHVHLYPAVSPSRPRSVLQQPSTAVVQAYLGAGRVWDEDDTKLCVVCMDAIKDTLYIPCGHLEMCFQCALKVKGKHGVCPMCRAPIQDVLRAKVQ